MADGLNPQQMLFKEAYLNPNSATFANAYKSAKLAEYSEEYAQNLTARGSDWLSEIVRDKELLSDAEVALKEATTYNILDDNGKRDVGIASLKLKAAMFAAETLGKSKYAKRNEHTGPDGKELPTPIIALNEIPRDNSDAEG